MGAEVTLEFHLKLKDGREMTQKINVPADGDGQNVPTVEQHIMQMLMQYANVGMLKKDRENKKFVLVTCGMIDTVEVSEPSIVSPGISLADLGNLRG